jgi:3-dehydroquinate dehydratase-2
MQRILIIHGPNLNLLGERQQEIYGTLTLEALSETIRRHAQAYGLELKCFQSNHEGAIIDKLHEERRWAQGLIINPGALTHYSYAIRDAITAIAIPAVEVHLSDIYRREFFRAVSVIAPVCIAQICGHGLQSYLWGIDRLLAFAQRGLQ